MSGWIVGEPYYPSLNELMARDPYLKIAETHAQHLEAMCAAYLRLTNLPPDQVVLCQQMGQDGVYRFWFERREAVING